MLLLLRIFWQVIYAHLILCGSEYLDKDVNPFGIHKRNNKPSVVDLTGTDDKDLTNLGQYIVSKRDTFDESQLRYLVTNDPQSFVLFRDTDTVLVPHQDILNMLPERIKTFLDEGNHIEYEEVNIANYLDVQISKMMIPATACLSQQSTSGDGQLSFRYSISIEYGRHGDLNFGALGGLLNFTLAFSITKRIKVARTVSFSGIHSCDLKESQSVRLFYSPGTIQVTPRTRRIRYTLLNNMIEQDDWKEVKRVTLMTERVPMYFCAADSVMDLRCHESVSEYHDDDGYIIRSRFDSDIE